MNIVAVVYADLRQDFYGAPGRLGEDLAGEPVLTRTLQRLAAVKGLGGIALAAPGEQIRRVAGMAGNVRVRLFEHDRPLSPTLRALRAARAFGRYGWRGGLAGTTIFDEMFDVPLLATAIQAMGADSLLLVPAGAALLDVQWTSDLLAYHAEHVEQYRMAFNQAPPGLCGGVFSASLLTDLGEKQVYPGKLLAYDPQNVMQDPIAAGYNLTLPQWLVATPRRFIADNPRGLWLCRKIVEQAGPDVDGQTACRIAQTLPPEPWPREVTIELTTRRPIEDDLRPAAQRGDLPLPALEASLAGLEEAGDVNVMLAGVGDALLHPHWPEAVALAKRVGQVGLATYGTTMDLQVGGRLASAGVDLLQVNVDAVSDTLYAMHKRGGSASDVWENIRGLLLNCSASGLTTPMVIPAMLKTRQSLDEQDEFFEKCLVTNGWGLIIEPTTAGGQWPDRAVVHMAPPARGPCRRILNRLTLLSDGQVTACEEDLHGAHRLVESNILAAWRGEGLSSLRRLHAESRWAEHPLCKACQEFHRP